MNIGLGLGLVTAPRSPVARNPARGLPRVLGSGVALFTGMVCFGPALRLVYQLMSFVAGLEPDLDEVAAVAPTLAWSFLPFSLASLLWLLDAPLSSLVRLGSWSALTRRAGAYWASPDDVKGPEDVFARLLDEGPALRLDDVEGFVTYADAEQWPMRWRVLRGWVRAAQNRVDAAVRAGDEQLVLAGRSLPTLEAADRLDRVAKRLWPRHRLRTSVL